MEELKKVEGKSPKNYLETNFLGIDLNEYEKAIRASLEAQMNEEAIEDHWGEYRDEAKRLRAKFDSSGVFQNGHHAPLTNYVSQPYSHHMET